MSALRLVTADGTVLAEGDTWPLHVSAAGVPSGVWIVDQFCEITRPMVICPGVDISINQPGQRTASSGETLSFEVGTLRIPLD